MISGSFILLGILTAVIYYLFVGSKKKWDKSPPSPRGLPIVGNLFQLSAHQYIQFSKWAKQLGPIYRVDLLTSKMVVVSDHKMAKEMFSQSAFSGRMDFSMFDFILDGKVHGIINSEGEHWEELRHFTLRQLRDFGFGRNSMEESIMTEVTELIEGIKKSDGKSVINIKDRFHFAVVNSLWFIVTGKRHKQDDPELLSLTRKANATFNEMLESGGIILFVPWLAKMFPKITGYTKISKMLEEFSKIFKTPIEEHKKTYDDAYQRDFTDVFLKEIKKSTNPYSAFHGKLGEENLLATLGDLYFAGSDTTSTTLSWMMMYLSKFPDVQKKFQKEIEEITGNSRATSVADRPSMPYTEALIAETLRFSSITPTGVQHRALQDTEFKGYMIPKDTIITSLQHYIHFDPAVWGDPENFRPERFLSPDGKTFKKHEALLAFSTGRRQCLGETLARDSLFLFSTNMLQRFTIEFDKNGPDHGYEAEIGFILSPKPFHLIFKDRLM